MVTIHGGTIKALQGKDGGTIEIHENKSGQTINIKLPTMNETRKNREINI